MAKPIDDLKKKVVGDTTAPIDGDRANCRARECEMGNLVSDAMLDRVKDQGIQIAVQNGGGLRASIDQGEITMGEVLTVLPFQNTLSTFQLKGSDVVAALENGVSQIEEGGGRFPQVAGMKYSFDPSKPAGSRISDVMVASGGSFAPIEADTTYGVVSNNFMRAGGDGYKIFATDGMNAYDFGPGLEEVVATYLGNHNPYTPYLDGRITEVKADMADSDKMAKPAEAAAEPAMEKKADDGMEKKAGDGMEKKADDGMKKAEEMVKTDMKDAETAVENATTHVIQAGDSLWSIAEKYLGNGAQWKKIADENPGKNPRKLTVGDQLKIPSN
jgi:5'-nucleotidase